MIRLYNSIRFNDNKLIILPGLKFQNIKISIKTITTSTATTKYKQTV
jgi:hypothetical protein